MMETEAMDATLKNDAELVAESLAGNKDAFRQIVERYQTLLCSLAYSATGSVCQSEDLAQETFVTAWKDLAALREPAKLRSWLCSMVRFRISKQFRQQGRDPVHSAEPLEVVDSSAAPEPLPHAQAITNEETAILWRSLERIPEMYREPLVLFYREHQSIETVAVNLDLTEDTVKQRLARGRKMLQEQVIAFVEGALERTNPGQAFTSGVLAVLLITPGSSAKAATIAAASATGKAAAPAGFFSTIVCLLAKLLPYAAGTWMMLKYAESRHESKFLRKAWTLFWVVSILYVLGSSFGIPALVKYGYANAHSQIFTFGVLGATFGFFFLFLPPLFLWWGREVRRIRQEETRLSINSGVISRSQPYEYRSPRTLLGLPLVHIRFNCVKDGKTLPAKGWIAIGSRAYGIVFAMGPIAVGSVSIGAVSIGLLALGALSMGLVSIGGGAAGYIAIGGGAIGWLAAVGRAALAHQFALGGSAIAEHANDPAALAFIRDNVFFRHIRGLSEILVLIFWLLLPALTLYFRRRRGRRSQAGSLT